MIASIKNRWKWLALVAVVFLTVPPLAYAVVPALRASGVQISDSSGTSPIASTTAGIWNNGGSPFWRKTDGSDVAMTGGGGGGGTLPSDYSAGSSGIQTITLDSTRLGIKLKDAASPITDPLLTIQNNGSSVKYLDIGNSSAQTISSGVADGASAISLVVKSLNTLANAGARLLFVSNGGSGNGNERFSIDGSGNLFLQANTSLNGASAATNTTGLSVTPKVADGASSIGLAINNATTLANATAKLLSLQNNGTEKFMFYQNGNITINPASTITTATNSTSGSMVLTPTFSAGDGASGIGIVMNSASTNSGQILFKVTDSFGATNPVLSLDNNGVFKIQNGTTFQVANNGNISLAAQAQIIGASTSTNNTALSIKPNVADGASSVALVINNTTTLSNATSKLLSLQNNGTEVLKSIGSGALTTTLTSAVGVAQTPGLTESNTSAATSGAGNQQWSPGIQLSGQQYNGTSSVAVDWMIQTRPITASTSAADLLFQSRYNGGSWTNQFYINQSSTNTLLGCKGSMIFGSNDGAGFLIYDTAAGLRDGNHGPLGSTSNAWTNFWNAGSFSSNENTTSSTAYTAASTDFVVAMTANSARTFALPAANTFKGIMLIVKDASGGATGITINRAGSDTITTTTTGNTSVSVSVQGASAWLSSDGTSVWYLLKNGV